MKQYIYSLTFLVSTVLAQSTVQPSGTTGGGPKPQSSPTWLADIKPLPGNVQAYPKGDNTQIPTGPFTASSNITLQGYPTVWASPPTDSPEIQAVYQSIDWSLVPNSTVHSANKDGTPNTSGYDSSDPDCWWTYNGCTQSKHTNVPSDIAYCPNVGDFGISFDDGPLTKEDGGEWAEPNLYDALAKSNNQKAALFYIGSNVIQAPLAAQRALADGHTLCVHTWSHPAMTTQSNLQVIAELYWTLRAIKEVTGVTPKCWRPPYGDVDDRVRAIASQMGMVSVLWDYDTDDWNMPGTGGGDLSPATVDGYFEGWISARKNGTDNQHGHITLQHELNNATVSMAEKWLPQVQQAFRVIPFNQCMNISQPYWESNFVYPTDQNPNPASNTSASASITTTSPSASNTAAAVQPNNASNAAIASSSLSISSFVGTFTLMLIAALLV
ncbi:hypothetical protein BJ944DRAFT_171609 [Cunninghamella echinulata]|nr:hypothetical protein BJ944DRAFT_171609 [Cunninghamella echinulata]